MSRLVDLGQLLSSDQLTRTTLVDGSGVILDVDSLEVYTLNETGMTLVEALARGASSIDELVGALQAEYEVDEETARADILELVELLVQHLERRGLK